MRKRWMVRAWLVDGPSEPYPYQATYFTWKHQARRQVRELERSFSPGAVQIMVQRAHKR